MAPEDGGVRYARKACLPCRRSKRRCDKKVPRCDLCTRREVACNYLTRYEREGGYAQVPADWTPDGADASLSEGHMRNDEHEPSSTLPSSIGGIDANAIHFIAPHVFQQARLELPRPNLPIPHDVSALVGDASSIRSIAATFYTDIHRWFPIVSKKGFFTYLLNPLTQRRTELSLLALCMKLCCTAPASDAHGDGGNRLPLYRIAKRFHHQAETAGIQSIYVLQAGILIALYELGQAIYPAAYLTVGACARYGLALGIDQLSLTPVSDMDAYSWNKVEEKRRSWWAVVILDRFLSLSNPSRSLSTEDPTFDTYLPVDDAAWDDCTAKPSDAVQISNGFTLKMGSFARLAQSTYLLSQSLQSIKPATRVDDVPHHDETAQLRRTLLALVHAADSEVIIRRLEFCAQSVLSFSTILLLQEHHLGKGSANSGDGLTGPSLESLWYETRTALDRMAGAAKSCIATHGGSPEAPDKVPIFLMHAIYQVAYMLSKLPQDTPDGGTNNKIEALKQLLRLVKSRWRVAGVYLNILEAQEIAMSSQSIKTQYSVTLS